jgi:cell division inhibitor SepF
MGILDKVSNIFFREEEIIEDESAVEGPLLMPKERPMWAERENKNKKNNLLTIPSREQNNMEMLLVRASSYDDLEEIASGIKERKVVVVNFEDLDKDVAQRMVDFLSGAVFALDGQPKKVSGGTFIFSSSQVGLSGQITENDSNLGENLKGGFKGASWFRGGH